MNPNNIPIYGLGKIKYIVADSNFLKSPEKVFLFIGLFFGIIFLFLTPPFQVNDEPQHFYKAYEVSEFKSFGIFQNGINGDYLPKSIISTANELIGGIPFHPERKYDLDNSFLYIQYPLNQDQKVFTPSILGFYAPFSYIPQASGIFVGKIFNLSPLALMYLGRIINFFVWLLLIYTAIRLTPVAKWLFLFLALTPMSLFLAASLNQDASIIGVAFLTIALIFYYAFSDEKTIITNKDVLILLICILFLAFSKQVYSCIALLFLIIPLKKFKSKKDFFVKICYLIFPAIFIDISWSILVKPITTADFGSMGFDPNSQFLFILHHPVDYFLIFLHTLTLSTNVKFYLHSFIGGLGWLDAYPPLFVFFIYAGVLIFLGLFDTTEGIIISLKQKTILATIVILTTLVIFTSQYLVWNHVGASLIEGPTGRYFIPISPLIFLLFYTNKKIISKRNLNWFGLILITILIGILFISTYTVYSRYYLTPLALIIPLTLAISIFICQVLIFKYIENKKQREVYIC